MGRGEIYLIILSIISILVGASIRFKINKRRFNRRNAFGSEGFSSYEHSLIARSSERLGRIVSSVLILAGVLMLGMMYLNYRTSLKPKQKVEISAEKESLPKH